MVNSFIIRRSYGISGLNAFHFDFSPSLTTPSDLSCDPPVENPCTNALFHLFRPPVLAIVFNKYNHFQEAVLN